ncbi:MAG: membrane protein insertase YidC [Bacteroides sp.]|nr:MAG: membrane protein insertase YidC [Bacteroides sp.]
MNKNNYIGLLLITTIIFVFSFFMKEKDINHVPIIYDEVISNDTKNSNIRYYVLENEYIKIKISSLGGKICYSEIKNYKNWQNNPTIIFEENYKNSFYIKNDTYNFNTKNLVFNIKECYFQDNNYILKLISDSDIEYIYTIENKNSYHVDLDINLENINIDLEDVNINLQYNLIRQEKDIYNEKLYTKLYYKNSSNIVSSKDESNLDISINDQLHWISFKQNFFTSIIEIKNQFFSKNKFKIIDCNNDNLLKNILVSSDIKLNSSKNISLKFYFCPCQLSILQNIDKNLDKIIELGWGPLKSINLLLLIPFFNLLEKTNLNYGIIILIMTLAIKIGLFPLTYGSYMSNVKMKIIKPEIDLLKRKFGDNPYKLQQKYMNLYRIAGINPLGGCLAIVIQIPILLSFFYFFPSSFELRQKSFLWVSDLSSYDNFINFNYTIPFIGDHISLMCLLMTLSTILYTYSINQNNKTYDNMQYIGYLMPFLFFGFLNHYSAGLNYYYLCSNIITFLQQKIISKIIDEEYIKSRIKKYDILKN